MTYHNPEQSDDRENSPLSTLLSVFSQSPLRGKSRVQIIAIGTAEDVLQLIYQLHQAGLEVPLWSPPQPIPGTDEVVRIYTLNAGQNTGQHGR